MGVGGGWFIDWLMGSKWVFYEICYGSGYVVKRGFLGFLVLDYDMCGGWFIFSWI